MSSAARRAVLPMTGLDRLIVGSLATFLVIGLVVDWINAIGPAHGGITPENVHESEHGMEGEISLACAYARLRE